MDFRQLRYFVAVAEALSFSEAARRLHVSQPPLSVQIKALEEELGSALLERSRHHVALTPAGELFLDKARAALANLDQAREVVKQVASGEAGEIRVGFTASVPMQDMFPRAVHAFREGHRNAKLELVHMSTGQQLQQLENGEIDIAFLRPSPQFRPPASIAVREVLADRLVAVVPVAHPLAASAQEIDIGALSGERFLLFPRGLGCGLFDHATTLCNRAGFAPNVAQEAREATTIIGLVASGAGISVLPQIYARTGIPGVAYLPIAGLDAASRILMAHRAEALSPIMKKFVGYF
ncbi:LysR family transcriptional regulator [Cupriavidus sp.]|uniref:LysR family transcriptional regulator n=1 Tax=Cupriavidus sp. TaxID=1873897 RepID=UPI0025BDD1E3|nr:LysR family transcriptional regulator [Cupriavidus sp.]MCA3185802.1 LysR family transcriptional regulator [Cupriavidus sp.]MCA3188989.1 LysR family transcriptional regulator [Cupriavidus sp.]MCA3198708.1 LysR family transcriptional regulator [Cupriavidus sp.]MCA3201454.1 LysR family transcriptional regulator [Cupriavidus sp.]MCA3208646.1 LysR family transcriptional regulator [Cupriavidus sp.]